MSLCHTVQAVIVVLSVTGLLFTLQRLQIMWSVCSSCWVITHRWTVWMLEAKPRSWWLLRTARPMPSVRVWHSNLKCFLCVCLQLTEFVLGFDVCLCLAEVLVSSAKADLTLQDANKNTALHLACSKVRNALFCYVFISLEVVFAICIELEQWSVMVHCISCRCSPIYYSHYWFSFALYRVMKPVPCWSWRRSLTETSSTQPTQLYKRTVST